MAASKISRGFRSFYFLASPRFLLARHVTRRARSGKPFNFTGLLPPSLAPPLSTMLCCVAFHVLGCMPLRAYPVSMCFSCTVSRLFFRGRVASFVRWVFTVSVCFFSPYTVLGFVSLLMLVFVSFCRCCSSFCSSWTRFDLVLFVFCVVALCSMSPLCSEVAYFVE